MSRMLSFEEFSPSGPPLDLSHHQQTSPEEKFLKGRPKSKVHSLVRGLLVHVSKKCLGYTDRAKKFDSLSIIIKHHFSEIINHGLVEPILREASKVIASSTRAGPTIAPLLHSAGATILAMGREVHGPHLLPLITLVIKEHFPSGEDGRRQCAMVLIGMCVRLFGDSVDPMAKLFWEILVAGIHDESPDVREAACFSLGFWASHPQLVRDIETRYTPILSTIVNLCYDTLTDLAASTILLPLLKNGAIQGEEHNLMMLSFQLLEELPSPFKYFSPTIMGHIASSLGNSFSPYLGASMRRLEDFASLSGEQDFPFRLAIMCATSSFANAVGSDAFLPYMEGSVANALQALGMRPPMHVHHCLTFVGVLAQLSGENFSRYLPIIATRLISMTSIFTEKHELILAESTRHIVDATRGVLHRGLLPHIQHFINILSDLLSRQNPAIRLRAIHALFRLTVMLQKIEVNNTDEPKRHYLETQAKNILLNVNLIHISYMSPFDGMPVSTDHLLSLDIILGGLEDSAELFPASNVLFTKSTVLGSYILDLSDYIPNLISRCGSLYYPHVRVYAYATLAHILTSTNDISWDLVEAWVLKLLPVLYRGMNQGEPALRPAAIRAIGRLVYRTRSDLSVMYPCLLRPLHEILTCLSRHKRFDPTIQAAASTLSLLVLKNPGIVNGDRIRDTLTGALSFPLESDDMLLVFKALKAVISVQRMCNAPTTLFRALLRSYGNIIGDPDNLSYHASTTKEIARTMLGIIFDDGMGAIQTETIDLCLLLEELQAAVYAPNFSGEMNFVTLTSCLLVTDEGTSGLNPKDSQTAAVTRVPPEVIAQIMVFSLPRGCQWDMAGSEDMPRVLGQVNGTWRQVALYTPNIWEDLDIELGSRSCEERSDGIASAITVWLTRSGGLPVNIFMQCLFSNPSLEYYRHLDRVACAILPFSRFWKDVYLRLPFSNLKQFYQGHHKHYNLSRLRSLCMVGAGPTLRSNEPSLALEFAPSLRVLTLHDVGLEFNTLQVPWSQLTELRLKISWLTTQQCMEILSSCLQLKFLHLTNQQIERVQEPYSGPVVTLPCLEVLHVNHGFNRIVLLMATPHLQELCMEHPGFSVRFTWKNGGLYEFISTLAQFKEQGVPPSDQIFDLIHCDKRNRKFLFTILDPNLSTSMTHAEMLPNLAAFAQCMGSMEVDCSLCLDQDIPGIVTYIIHAVSIAPVYDVAVVVRRGIGENLAKELTSICAGSVGTKLAIGMSGFEAHIMHE